MLAQGAVVDHYRIIRKLGSGGMADVYEAEESGLARRVALKVLTKGRVQNEETLVRFQREASSAASLNHRGIVHIYKVGYDASLDVHYMSMRLLTGGDLCKRINEGMSAGEALTIVRELADAFRHAHSKGVIHRDVKPSNVLFDEQDCPVLTDFGIAKALDSVGLTRTGVAMGTPTYMSPEQAAGIPSDARSDLYSLGVMLHEMVCGLPPFRGDNVVAVIFQHQQAPIPPLPADFGWLEPLVRSLMAKNPDDRPSSAAQLIAHLNTLMGIKGPMTPQGITTTPSDPYLLPNLELRTSGKQWASGRRPIVASDISNDPTHILERPGTPQRGQDRTPTPSAQWVAPAVSEMSGPAGVAAVTRSGPSLLTWVLGALIAILLIAGGATIWHFQQSALREKLQAELKLEAERIAQESMRLAQQAMELWARQEAERAELERLAEEAKRKAEEAKARARKMDETKRAEEAEKVRKADEENKAADAEKLRKADEEKAADAEKLRKADEEKKAADAEKLRKADEEKKAADAEKLRKADETKRPPKPPPVDIVEPPPPS